MIGVILGLCLARVLQSAPSHGFGLAASLTFVFLATGLSQLWYTSPLLTCLTLGVTVVHQYPYVNELLHDLDEIMAPLHVVFFGGIGAAFSPASLTLFAPVTVGYTIARAMGKAAGVRMGAVHSEAPDPIRRYLWPTLLPQTGISLGLIAVVGTHFPQLRDAVGAVMFASSAIYILVGFPLAHRALQNAHEASRPD